MTETNIRYLNQKGIKDFFHSKGRRISKTAIFIIDRFLQDKFNAAAEIKNGGKKTVDEDVINYVGLRVKS